MAYPGPSEIKRVAVIGLGTVGSSWAALMLAKGLEIHGFDPGDATGARARSLISGAWPSLVAQGLTTLDVPPFGALRMAGSIEEAVAGADLVQENTPELPEEKREVLRRIGESAGPGVIVLSSTGGFPPSTLQEHCAHPERLVVFHPFNPTHLVPLVEIVPGRATAPEVTDWAMEFAAYLGKKPIRLNSEIVGHMTNRLQFALVREAVRCMVEGVASARDIDAAVRYGLAPRWMLMGGLQTLNLAGGNGGMKAILDHAGSAIETWWAPGAELRLSEEVKSILVDAGRDLSDDLCLADWMAWRDSELVPLLQLQAAAEANHPNNRNKTHV